tara:strand:- start:1459 stop:1776 length:318 start_codon:yes stop_codon:yes gene_type:complete
MVRLACRYGGIKKLKYRTNMQIMGQVLDKMQDAGTQGLIISRLTQKANLSHDRLVSLTDNLIGSGLITKIEYDGRNSYVITEKGIMFLSEYQKFYDFANSFGLEL